MHCSKVIVTLHQRGRWEASFCSFLAKPHLPEVTIKTHLSAEANVFISDSTPDDFTCSFVASHSSLKAKVIRKIKHLDYSEAWFLAILMYSKQSSAAFELFRFCFSFQVWKNLLVRGAFSVSHKCDTNQSHDPPAHTHTHIHTVPGSTIPLQRALSDVTASLQ